MTTSSRRVVCATRRPSFATAFRAVLLRAGFTWRPLTVPPELLLDAVTKNAGCLVIVDGNSSPSWYNLAEARRSAPDSHFVLCSKRVKPEAVRAAFESGLHGVISLRLAVDEAAQALAQICRGERQFRFDPPAPFTRPDSHECARDASAAAAQEAADFDELWMFEGTPGV